MKVNCASIVQIKSSKPYSPSDVIKYVRAAAGKKAVVEVADTAMGIDLVAAARAAFKVDPSVAFSGIALLFNGEEVDDNKSLSALGIKDSSSVQIQYQVTL